MSAIISILGAKGGTGKTTVAHMLCHGLSLIGRKAVYVMCDGDRDPPPAGTLPYVFADARSPDARQRVLATLKGRAGWIGVIDGGANRTERDSELYRASDLVMLPFRDSAEDLRVICKDLARLPRAFALPSQWPSNPWQFQAAQKLLASAPVELHRRSLAPVFSLSASKLLLQLPQPASFPSPVNNASRALARYCLRVLDTGGTSLPAGQSALEATERVLRMMEARDAHAGAQA